MLNLINVTTPITVDGVAYGSSQEAYDALKGTERQIVVHIPRQEVHRTVSQFPSNIDEKATEQEIVIEKINENSVQYLVHVKQFMLEKSSPGFEYMRNWNNDTPMPLAIMKGEILEDVDDQLRMRLAVKPEPATHCFRCGRKLTNKVSVLYGIGPECGGHLNINPLNSVEELEAAMDDIRNKMERLAWEGWIPKSTIKEMVEIGKGDA